MMCVISSAAGPASQHQPPLRRRRPGRLDVCGDDAPLLRGDRPAAAGTPSGAAAHTAAVVAVGRAGDALPEEIDVGNDVQVQEALVCAALQDGTALLVADAGWTTFCGCGGAALMHAHDQAALAGVHLLVVASSHAVLRILELTGADQVLDIYPTLPAALAGRPGRAPQPQGAAPPCLNPRAPLQIFQRARNRDTCAARPRLAWPMLGPRAGG